MPLVGDFGCFEQCIYDIGDQHQRVTANHTIKMERL